MNTPPEWKPGDPVTTGRLDAELRERTANARLKVDPSTGLELAKMPWGHLLRRVLPRPIYGTLSGGGPSYTFVEAVELGGTWGAGPTAGTAYEVNGVTGLSGTRQWLHPDRTLNWRFQSFRPNSLYPFTGSSGTIPGCFCTAIPTPLTMTSTPSPSASGTFNSCTIVYGPTPSAYSSLSLGVNSFLSTASFPDPTAGGALFQYFLNCSSNQFFICRVFATSPFGSPFRETNSYSWTIGSSGNTCTSSPPSLSLPGGTNIVGDLATVTITG